MSIVCRAKGRAKLEAAKGGKSQLGSRAQALKVKCPKCFTPMSDYVRAHNCISAFLRVWSTELR